MFWERFVKLCVENSTKPNPVAAELKISSGAVNKWKNGAQPHDTTLIKIADYFHVSVDYLLGNTDERRPAPGRPIAIMGADTKHGGVRMVDTPEGAKISEIRDYLDRFTLDQLNDVLQYVKFLNSKA